MRRIQHEGDEDNVAATKDDGTGSELWKESLTCFVTPGTVAPIYLISPRSLERVQG